MVSNADMPEAKDGIRANSAADAELKSFALFEPLKVVIAYYPYQSVGIFLTNHLEPIDTQPDTNTMINMIKKIQKIASDLFPLSTDSVLYWIISP